MRVLHILAQLRASGAEQMLRVAAPYWRAAGLDMDVLETAVVPGHFQAPLEAAGFTVLRHPLSRRPRDVTSLRALIRAGGYDVVHIHPEGADLIPAFAARLAGTPAVVRTVHHIFPYEGALRYRKRLERRIGHTLGMRYICNSKSGSANETNTLRNPHRLVFNWYDDAYFQPPSDEQRVAAREALGVTDEDVIFASVGGCASYKNHDLILRALARTPNVLYFHAGPEPDGSERRLATELGVQDRAHFLGVVPDVRQIFYASDGYVMPSTIEGFGVAATEALGCGVPVILSDRPALWDLKGLIPGVWIPLETGALADAMQALADKPSEQRRAEGAEASSIVRQRFGTQRGAEGYLNAYRYLLSGRH